MKKGFWIVVENIIRRADIILEILDARMPEITRNIKLEEYAASCHKPLILVINKIDIVSRETIESIKRRYATSYYVLVSSKLPGGIGELMRMIKSKVSHSHAKVAVIGYPNTGKSMLINRLSRGGRARTSSESGFTKGLQLIAGKQGLTLFDTPGVVPFADRDEVRLGLVSGISPSKLDNPDFVAYELIKLFQDSNPGALEKEYGLNLGMSPEEVLIEFGRKSNMLIKGGVVDERRAAIRLISDWHKGKIRL